MKARASGPTAVGLVQAAKATPSRLHWVLAASLVLNANVSDVNACSAPSPGPESSAVAGGVVSTVHVRVAGTWSRSEPLTARTLNVCCPSASGPTVSVAPQLANAAPSTEH
jgi:hypothetical protein